MLLWSFFDMFSVMVFTVLSWIDAEVISVMRMFMWRNPIPTRWRDEESIERRLHRRILSDLVLTRPCCDPIVSAS